MRKTTQFHINSFALSLALFVCFVLFCFFFKERPGKAKETVPFTKADRLGTGKN